MLFNSLEFILFFGVVAALYFLFISKYRWGLLLVASYYFYMSWNPAYIGLIILSTCVDYFAGLKMGGTEDKGKRKKYLYLSLFINLGLLFTFKYFNFFNNSLSMIVKDFNMTWGIPTFDLLLPVGISFYTFQTLSYTIDVYRGKKKPERHFGIFALYVSFFPQLVAGPIERSTRLLPQFKEKYEFNYNRVTSGLQLMLWGYFKKVVVADRLAIFVNGVYNDVDGVTGIPLILATVFFAFQIYCDFSGYSDIAIGSAKIMGFDLMENFKRPYYSKSISEFWKRWHISLSTWFKDYLYIPLGGNRVPKLRHYFNLFATFLVSGLWHGANWTFVIWGALHGMYQLVGVATNDLREKQKKLIGLNKIPAVDKILKIIITFILVDFAWIFFRANNISDAFYIVNNLFTGLTAQLTSIKNIQNSISGFGFSKVDLLIALFVILVMESIHFIQRYGSIRGMVQDKPVVIRWSLYYLLILMILMFGVFGSNQFIYFQF